MLKFLKNRWSGILALLGGTAAYRLACAIVKQTLVCAPDSKRPTHTGLFVTEYKLPYSTVVGWPIQGTKENFETTAKLFSEQLRFRHREFFEEGRALPYTMDFEPTIEEKSIGTLSKRGIVGAIIAAPDTVNAVGAFMNEDGMREIKLRPMNVLAVHCKGGWFGKLLTSWKIKKLQKVYYQNFDTTLKDLGEPVPYLGTIKVNSGTVVFMPYPQDLKYFRPPKMKPIKPLSKIKQVPQAKEVTKQEIEAKKRHHAISRKEY